MSSTYLVHIWADACIHTIYYIGYMQEILSCWALSKVDNSCNKYTPSDIYSTLYTDLLLLQFILNSWTTSFLTSCIVLVWLFSIHNLDNVKKYFKNLIQQVMNFAVRNSLASCSIHLYTTKSLVRLSLNDKVSTTSKDQTL